MKIVGVTINSQNEAVFLACNDDVDFEGIKELYADDGEGQLDIYSGFDNHCFAPFEGISDEALVKFLKDFSDGAYGEVTMAVRLEGGVVAVSKYPENYNPVVDAGNGNVLYKSLSVTTSDDPEERDEYDAILGVQVV